MVKSLLCKHEPRSENACGKTEILLFGLKLGEYLENPAALSPTRISQEYPPRIESLPAGRLSHTGKTGINH